MPRAKSDDAKTSAELDAEIKNLQFVERAKSITRDMFQDDQETAYELIERLLRNPVKAIMREGTEEEWREALLRAGGPEDEIENLD